MNQALNLATKLIISGLLVYAAVEDIRTRKVP